MEDKRFDESIINLLMEKYAVPKIDILMIAINRYGIQADIEDHRLRFKIQFINCDIVFYMAVCINTYKSVFELKKNGDLLLCGDKIGKIFDIEEDTCDSTYFRRNRTEMTLNSNMRSLCKGCTFCGTYRLDPDDRIDMSDEKKIEIFLEKYLKESKIQDLSNLVGVTLCTGCFADEMKLVEHILMIYKIFRQYGFNQRIRYIGSQIRNDKAMDVLQSEVPTFALSLTVECFSNRKNRLRKEKGSLNMDGIKRVLECSLEHNFSTNYLYITGLDEIPIFEQGIKDLKTYVNRFPIFQIMQNYIVEHEEERAKDAYNLEYYLLVRNTIESVFMDTGMKPRSWENYRGLFYTMYQSEYLDSIRI